MMTRRRFALAGAAFPFGGYTARAQQPPRGSVNVSDFAASGAGSKLDTKAIQSAIDAVSQRGGGQVLFPPGVYLSGTLDLKSGVTLHLTEGARLLGSNDLRDYPHRLARLRSYTANYTRTSLIFAEGQQSVGITGTGVIDGHGAAFEGPYLVRPYLIRFISCRNVNVRDVTIRDSPMWVQHYLDCDDVYIHGITVRSVVNKNNDGIDIDSCRGVRISDCDIDSEDDAIVLKSTTAKSCEHVVISNCIVRSICNGIKLGTESNGGFRNIAIGNCVLHRTRLSGIALECVDGGVLDGIVVSNISMRGVGCPVFIRLGDRGRAISEGMPRPPLGAARNITISNVRATGASRIGCSITSVPERFLENVTLFNIDLEFSGGGTLSDASRVIAEEREHYPEHSMFGRLPAFGLYCRHVRGLSMDNVRLATADPDPRPALVCDDVEDLTVRALTVPAETGRETTIALRDVRRAFVQGCRAPAGSKAFMRVSGSRSEGIAVGGNDFTGAADAVQIGEGAPQNAIRKL